MFNGEPSSKKKMQKIERVQYREGMMKKNPKGSEKRLKLNKNKQLITYLLHNGLTSYYKKQSLTKKGRQNKHEKRFF